MKLELRVVNDTSLGLSYERLVNFVQDVFHREEDGILKQEAREIIFLLEHELNKTLKEKGRSSYGQVYHE